MSRSEQWQLRGSAPESYERYQVPSVFAPLATLLLDQAALETGQHVLDVACGTGIVARLAAPQVGSSGEVVGIDLNLGMLKVARQCAETAGVSIKWRQGDAMDLPFTNDRFDLVLCQQGLQFFPNQVAALREMHRVLVPGGQLALCVWKSMAYSPCNLATAKGVVTKYSSALNSLDFFWRQFHAIAS